MEPFCSFPCSCRPHGARPAPRPVAARECPHREALWKVMSSRDARSESFSVVVVVFSRPLQELLAQGAHHHTLYSCSCSPSRHPVRRVLSLSQRCGSDIVLASSSCLAVPVGGSGLTESRSRPEPCSSRCRWRSRPEQLLSLHCDCSSHPFVLGARLVQSHGYVHLVLLPPACHQVVVVSRIVAARPCRDWSQWHASCCAATAVPHLVHPPGTDFRSPCRSLASVSQPVSTPRRGVLLALVCFYLHCVQNVMLTPHRCESPATLRYSGLVSGPWRILRLQPANRAWDLIFYLCKRVLTSSRTNLTTAEMCEVS